MRISDWSSDVCSSDLGAPELVADTRFSTAALRVANRRELDAIIEAFFSSRSRAALEVVLREAAIAYGARSEEHTSELQSLMRISYAVFCLKKKTHTQSKIHARIRATNYWSLVQTSV